MSYPMFVGITKVFIL